LTLIFISATLIIAFTLRHIDYAIDAAIELFATADFISFRLHYASRLPADIFAFIAYADTPAAAFAIVLAIFTPAITDVTRHAAIISPSCRLFHIADCRLSRLYYAFIDWLATFSYFFHYFSRFFHYFLSFSQLSYCRCFSSARIADIIASRYAPTAATADYATGWPLSMGFCHSFAIFTPVEPAGIRPQMTD
jgi:hypothetical protein